MQILNGILMLLMILFIAVQYNDPDGKLWMAIYAVPLMWTAVVVFRRPLLVKPIVSALLLLSMVVSAVGLIYFWPESPAWWRQEVWWETETAREGMGMMIIAITLAIVWLSRPKVNSSSPG